MEYHITLPSKPRIVSEEDMHGVYEIDSLYPGYGQCHQAGAGRQSAQAHLEEGNSGGQELIRAGRVFRAEDGVRSSAILFVFTTVGA